MKAIEGKLGRVFVLRLNHDDPLPKTIEEFAAEKGLGLAQVVFIGGIYKGNLVSGPRRTEDPRPEPIILPISEAHETTAAGVIALAEDGKPKLHMHGALGRAGQTTAGCFQSGLSVWLVGEAVIQEILTDGPQARRVLDKTAQLRLLEILE